MRLSLIKHITQFVQENDIDFVHESIALLEHLFDARGIKEDELDTLGEIVSNLYGAVEVDKMIKEGKDPKLALNEFMKRVTL